MVDDQPNQVVVEKMVNDQPNQVVVGKVTFAQLKLLARFLFATQKKKLFLLMTGQLCIVLLQEIVGYLIGLVASHFYLVLEADPRFRSHSQLVELIVYAVVIMLISSFIKASNMLVTGFVSISWRESLTLALHKKYFSTPRTTYIANEQSATKDNPDQRIASDASSVCSDLSQFIPTLLISPFTISYYTYQCWLITNYVGPVAVFSFFLIATIVNKLLMDPVAKWTYRQEKFEGDFRYNHMLVRTHCEASAFYQLHKVEEVQTNSSLDSLLGVQERLMYFQYMQNMFITLCDYIVSVLSYILVSIPIFSGRYDNLSGGQLASLVSQYSFKSMTLFNCFTKLTDLSQQAAPLLGNSQRVADFIQALDLINTQDGKGKAGRNNESGRSGRDGRQGHTSTAINSESSDTNILIDSLSEAADDEIDSHSSYQMTPFDPTLSGSAIVELRNVSIQIPASNRLLMDNFSYSFLQGKNVLITGPSGAGKSSLLRVIGRLWKCKTGSVTIKGSIGYGGTVSIVPQKPYFITGITSLADQIYLDQSEREDHREIVELLEEVGLQELAGRYGAVDVKIAGSWFEEMTPGEAQRLSIVRILYHKPQLVFLDEATSQVDTTNELKIYDLLRSRDITVVSVGHRQSIRQYHSVEIFVNGDTTYRVSDIN